MVFPEVLENLARILRICKRNGRGYNVLLTSAISVTPAVLTAVAGSPSWQLFCEELRRRGTERIYILEDLLQKKDNYDGYKALSKIIIANYFSTVITTNIDSSLEDALFEYQVRLPRYQNLVVDRDKDEYIAKALADKFESTRIVKLRGSLSDRVIPESYPEFFELRPTLRTGMERFLNQDIIIVGSLDSEDDLRRLLSSSGGSIYYVVPEEPSKDDDVIKALRMRGNDPTAFVVSGPFGNFSTFFTALAALLLGDTAETNISPLLDHSVSRSEPKPSALPLETVGNLEVEQPKHVSSANVQIETTPTQETIKEGDSGELNCCPKIY